MQVLEDHLHPAHRSAQRRVGVEHNPEPQRAELAGRKLRGRSALNDVHQKRSVDPAADLVQLGGRLGRLDEDHVGAGLAVELGALKRRLEPEHLAGVGAGDDEQRVVGAGVEGGVQLGHHLGRRDDLLAGEVAAALGEGLILELNRVGAAPLERLHGPTDVQRSAEPGVGVDDDRDATPPRGSPRRCRQARSG